jgi:hypothetical protein
LRSFEHEILREPIAEGYGAAMRQAPTEGLAFRRPPAPAKTCLFGSSPIFSLRHLIQTCGKLARYALRKPSKGELAHREWRRRGAHSIIGTHINHHTAPIGQARHEQVSSRLPSRLVS